MSQQIYTIVITDGAFQGASQHTDRGDAVPINLADLKKVIPKLDGAAVEKLDKIEAKHAAELAAKDAEIATLDDLREKLAEKTAFQATMEQRVTAVLQSADPAQYEALAVDFLTPAKDKEKAEKRAKAKALKAEASAIEAELGIE